MNDENGKERIEAEIALYTAVYEADNRAEREGWKTLKEVKDHLKKSWRS